MLPIHTAAQVANSTSPINGVGISWVGVAATALVVVLVCWLNRKNV